MEREAFQQQQQKNRNDVLHFSAWILVPLSRLLRKTTSQKLQRHLPVAEEGKDEKIGPRELIGLLFVARNPFI